MLSLWEKTGKNADFCTEFKGLNDVRNLEKMMLKVTTNINLGK